MRYSGGTDFREAARRGLLRALGLQAGSFLGLKIRVSPVRFRVLAPLPNPLGRDANPSKPPEIGDIPTELKEPAQRARHELIEGVAEYDDRLMEQYIHDQPPTEEQLRAGIRRATITSAKLGGVEGDSKQVLFVPVLCGASFRNIGVQPLLDAVCDYLPSPLDVDVPAAHNPVNDDIVPCAPDE